MGSRFERRLVANPVPAEHGFDANAAIEQALEDAGEGVKARR